jgi:channel protein, hemolysin III family
MLTDNGTEVLLNFYSRNEERANALTHAAGALVAVAGLIVLGIQAGNSGWLALTATMIYGGTLLSMYLASTAYHAVRNDRWKMFCRRMDHCAIYLLIAGTYTPLMLLAVGGWKGWTLLLVTWTLAVAGISVKCVSMKSFYGLSLVLYLCMGWMCVLIVRTLIATMTTAGFAFLVAGGLLYSFGVIFYLINRPYSHTVWHLFVMGGSAMHYLMVVQLC